MKTSRLMPVLLVTCIAVVMAWEAAAKLSRRSFGPFSLSAADLAGFQPRAPGWSFQRFEAEADDPSAPNLAAYMVKRCGNPAGNGGHGMAVLVRLAHGYNMPDCMRLKGYKVELVADTDAEISRGARRGREDGGSRTSALSASSARDIPRLQTWRLTSDIGDVSIACSAMLRTGDFGGTGIDIRDMAFPRIAKPIGPEWDPVGFRLSSLRHPLKSLAMLCRVKWNNARCDPLTFLKLRQPAWASNEYLSFLATSRDVRVTPGDEAVAVREVRAAHTAVYGELYRWRARGDVEAGRSREIGSG